MEKVESGQVSGSTEGKVGRHGGISDSGVIPGPRGDVEEDAVVSQGRVITSVLVPRDLDDDMASVAKGQGRIRISGGGIAFSQGQNAAVAKELESGESGISSNSKGIIHLDVGTQANGVGNIGSKVPRGLGGGGDGDELEDVPAQHGGEAAEACVGEIGGEGETRAINGGSDGRNGQGRVGQGVLRQGPGKGERGGV